MASFTAFTSPVNSNNLTTVHLNIIHFYTLPVLMVSFDLVFDDSSVLEPTSAGSYLSGILCMTLDSSRHLIWPFLSPSHSLGRSCIAQRAAESISRVKLQETVTGKNCDSPLSEAFHECEASDYPVEFASLLRPMYKVDSASCVFALYRLISWCERMLK